jgi:GAF domain-containing protein
MPEDEDQRLLDLRDLAILDTPPEQRFDRLTRLAAAALEVPIALVSLVDADRQWFKSCFGLQEREMPRDLAFCAHAVQNKADLIVPDTLLDDRFADNPLVTGAPRIRFYAGAALMLDDGNCLGTLCVIDTRPRNLSASDLALLRDLRDLALKELQSGQA